MANSNENQNSNSTEQVIQKVSNALEKCNLESLKDKAQLEQALVLARGMYELRKALTDDIVTRLLLPLQGSSLGFRTDLDSKSEGYDVKTVRDCAIEAMIRGFRIVGNEFNIISSRAYFTKEGLDRRVNEFPGLTELELEPGVPSMAGDKGALVPYSAKWKLHGKTMELVRDIIKRDDGTQVDRRIPVKINSGMGMDAILGKAKRKMLAHILERLTGAKFSEMDADVIDVAGETVPEERKNGAKSKVEEILARQREKRAAEAKHGTDGATAGGQSQGSTAEVSPPPDGDAAAPSESTEQPREEVEPKSEPKGKRVRESGEDG